MEPNKMSDGDKKEKTTDTEKAATYVGSICINQNSAGGTCAHREKEHGGPGGGCMLCDCDTFIPNA